MQAEAGTGSPGNIAGNRGSPGSSSGLACKTYAVMLRKPRLRGRPFTSTCSSVAGWGSATAAHQCSKPVAVHACSKVALNTHNSNRLPAYAGAHLPLQQAALGQPPCQRVQQAGLAAACRAVRHINPASFVRNMLYNCSSNPPYGEERAQGA